MKKETKNAFAEFWGIPADIIMKAPRIQMIGDMEIYVENYDAIALYSPEDIKIAVNEGMLCVSGVNLRIVQAELHSLMIKGVIKKICFE